MQTFGWVLILISALIIRGLTKGRGFTDIPKDLGDLFTAVISSDLQEASAVLARTGDANTAVVAETPTLSAPAADAKITGRADKAALVAFGKQLQGMGYRVAEHPAFGGVHPVHVKNSQHYAGEAIDVNADTGFRGGEKAALDNVNKMAKAAGFTTIWQAPGHYDHIHVAVKR